MDGSRFGPLFRDRRRPTFQVSIPVAVILRNVATVTPCAVFFFWKKMPMAAAEVRGRLLVGTRVRLG